jgi:cobalt/nickel transport system permease protein
VSLIVVGIALRRVGSDLGERQVPLMGVLAAAIFAGQMLNFSVTGGTSGHLLGAAIAAILLGPWPAVLVLTTVVSVQALLFQDGGLLVLGANIFNMAIVGVFVVYAVYTSLLHLFRGRSWGIFVAGFTAAWSSIFLASLACALELALSGTSPANIAITAMGGIHALIGIGEGLITVGALVFIYATRRDLLKVGEVKPARWSGMGCRTARFSRICKASRISNHPRLYNARNLKPDTGNHPGRYDWCTDCFYCSSCGHHDAAP